MYLIRQIVWALLTATYLCAEEGILPIAVVPGTQVSIATVSLSPVCDQEMISKLYGRNEMGHLFPIGRTSRKLNASELESLVLPENHLPSVTFTRSEESFFDLWDLAQKAGVPPNAVLRLEFHIKSVQVQDVFLGFGSFDEATIFLNHQAVFSCLGRRDLFNNNNIIPLRLCSGNNTIVVFCRKVDDWKRIPEHHYDNAWGCSMTIYGSEELAWKQHCIDMFHPLDVPIAESFSDLRVEAAIDGFRMVEVFDHRGIRRTGGIARDDGHVDWNDLLEVKRLGTPFIGMIAVGGQQSEPILVIGSQTIDEVSNDVIAHGTADKEGKMSVIRLERMLLPQYSQSRDVWWARKVALALLMIVHDKSAVAMSGLMAKCGVTRIQFYHYTSHIDGTDQFYRFFEARKGPALGRAVAVILPTVPNPVRPPLESVSIADLASVENLASVADSEGVSLLFPGYVDVDYGGDLMRRELDECLADFNARFNAEIKPRIYIMGVCSAGVDAIGYSSTRDTVNGLVLYSPVINRRVRSWLPGFDVDQYEFPESALAKEGTSDAVDLLKKMPILLIYDSGMAGHGAREDSVTFVELLMALGGNITSRWPKLVTEDLWGERYKARSRPWLNWIYRDEQRQGRGARQQNKLSLEKMTEVDICSVKDALLLGFNVEEPNDPVFDSWLQEWARIWTSYRGEKWTKSMPPRPTTVFFSLLDGESIGQLNNGKLIAGVPQMGGGDTKKFSTQNTLFGFYLVKGTNNVPAVKVFRSERTISPLPRIDLMLDGCCRGALWQKKGSVWTLVQ
ncbi:MAG: hypothetical protein WC378_05085, partial [Opitutaceae bacterium]